MTNEQVKLIASFVTESLREYVRELVEKEAGLIPYEINRQFQDLVRGALREKVKELLEASVHVKIEVKQP